MTFSQCLASTLFANGINRARVGTKDPTLVPVRAAFRGIQSGVFAGLEKFDALAKLNILDGVVPLIVMVFSARLMGVEGAVLGLALGGLWRQREICPVAGLRVEIEDS